MVYAANLGYPRIGFKRELKVALEKYWSNQIDEQELIDAGKDLRFKNWLFQLESDIDFIPSNDFSFYDHVLDTIAMVGAVPKRFGWNGGKVDLKTYFLMARGIAKSKNCTAESKEAPAMDMTKWFNTNYHFIVPELEEEQPFTLSSTKFLEEFLEAKAIGILTRPVFLGPVTFLSLAKSDSVFNDPQRLERLLDVYCQALAALRANGAQWVQMDEPCLSADMDNRIATAFEKAYARLNKEGISIMLTSYFAPLRNNLALALRLPVQGIHLDLINGKEDLQPLLKNLPAEMMFSAGVIDGHNVWRADLDSTLEELERIGEAIGPARLIVAPSCSLLHVPIDVDAETNLNPEVKGWLAFAQQKIREVSVLADALTIGKNEVAQAFEESSGEIAKAKTSSLRTNLAVENRLKNVDAKMENRLTAFAERSAKQQADHGLPLFPTTTIGSFPQTKTIRTARAQFKAKKISADQYRQQMENEITANILLQEKIGLDVFVHGEPERTDMVEYFAESLDGMAVTQHGWVQSYGSRCVRAPIIYGSVSRPQPMTVDWAKFAQNQTSKPVKGMLTGPVTILQWSFVRDDQSRQKTCLEIALAIRDEVVDLEAAGIKIIQIDEPAIREGLPLRRTEWSDYLKWSTRCFRVSVCGVSDATQVHTHMCYSEFGDMVEAIASMDADVISIEASRSKMDLLESLKDVAYPNAIGPGIYDIHSPRVPTKEEMVELLEKANKVIPSARLWVNPDCGLKTRGWEEVVPALNAMVEAAWFIRAAQGAASP